MNNHYADMCELEKILYKNHVRVKTIKSSVDLMKSILLENLNNENKQVADIAIRLNDHLNDVYLSLDKLEYDPKNKSIDRDFNVGDFVLYKTKNMRRIFEIKEISDNKIYLLHENQRISYTYDFFYNSKNPDGSYVFQKL